MLTLNQIKQVIQVKSDCIIKELKASSSLTALRLYTEITYFIIIISLIFEAQISAHVFCEITIKLDSETLK